MIISVDPDAPMPVYEQICEQVLRMVVAGTLAPGARMPTIRQLANDLDLAKGTVAKAYGQLEAGRVLETFGHRGTFIAASPIPATGSGTSVEEALLGAADAYVLAARQLGTDLDAAQAAVGARWDRLTGGEPP